MSITKKYTAVLTCGHTIEINRHDHWELKSMRRFRKTCPWCKVLKGVLSFRKFYNDGNRLPMNCEYCGHTFGTSQGRNKHLHKFHEKEIHRY